MVARTNIGEFIAGAYYMHCWKAYPVIYNQPLILGEPNIEPITGQKPWTIETVKNMAVGIDIHRAELDVIATVPLESFSDEYGEIPFIAECTERDVESRKPSTILRKAKTAALYEYLNMRMNNLTIEFWAPRFSEDILNNIESIREGCVEFYEGLYRGEQCSLNIVLVEGATFSERIKQLVALALTDTSDKAWNPFYRTLQLLKKAEVLSTS